MSLYREELEQPFLEVRFVALMSGNDKKKWA